MNANNPANVKMLAAVIGSSAVVAMGAVTMAITTHDQGMPAEVTLDLTGLWHRETELVGAYTYGTERLADGTTAKTFDLAGETADAIEAERWLSATYRLADHADAIAHAAAAGADLLPRVGDAIRPAARHHRSTRQCRHQRRRAGRLAPPPNSRKP